MFFNVKKGYLFYLRIIINIFEKFDEILSYLYLTDIRHETN